MENIKGLQAALKELTGLHFSEEGENLIAPEGSAVQRKLLEHITRQTGLRIRAAPAATAIDSTGQRKFFYCINKQGLTEETVAKTIKMLDEERERISSLEQFKERLEQITGIPFSFDSLGKVLVYPDVYPSETNPNKNEEANEALRALSVSGLIDRQFFNDSGIITMNAVFSIRPNIVSFPTPTPKNRRPPGMHS